MLKTASVSVALGLFAALFLIAPGLAEAQGAKPLKNVPVTGLVDDSLEFVGKVTIQSLDVVDGVLVASGVVKGAVAGDRLTQTFADIPLALSANDAGACDILFLDLAPLHLDLLGLNLDLAEVVLDLDAVSGPGALLGNLLCSLVGLLDGGLLGGLVGDLLGEVLDLIDAINALL